MTTASSRPARRRAAQRSAAVEITTFQSAVRFLYDRADIERQRAVALDARTFKLERMEELLEAASDPHRSLRAVHIAGTVGKGSTVAMIASMLRACGYAVGEYTSPHIVDIRERMQINGQMIGRNDFVELTKRFAEVTAKLDFEPSFFELMTAMAFTWFAEEAVDIAVIETGLGGRLDCTNVIVPEVSVITTIDYDHMHILGKTLGAIAGEKAGIMKRGVPAFTVEQAPEVEEVFRAKAAELGAPFKVINKDIEFSYRFGASPDKGPGTQVCLFTETSRFEHVPVPLPGEHQALNCGLALAVVDLLRGAGYTLPESKVHAGLAETKIPGRMELVWQRPRILVDGAHNAAAVSTLVRSVGAHVPYDSMVVIFGCCEDKDVYAMLEKVALGGDKVIFTRAKGVPRAADPQDLQQKFADRCGKMSQVAKDIEEALNLASRAVGREDLICVTGSFYLVGDAKKYLADLEKKRSGASEAT
jgi:dihydrofolate synthase/folylpolyglutamate synthase